MKSIFSDCLNIPMRSYWGSFPVKKNRCLWRVTFTLLMPIIQMLQRGNIPEPVNIFLDMCYINEILLLKSLFSDQAALPLFLCHVPQYFVCTAKFPLCWSTLIPQKKKKEVGEFKRSGASFSLWAVVTGSLIPRINSLCRRLFSRSPLNWCVH